MKYSIDKKEQYSILKLQEEKLDSPLSPALKSEFVTLNAEGIKNIIIDLSEVKYVDSSGLSALLVGNRIYNEDGSLARNHCVQSSHEPGSVFKAITLAAALDGGYAALTDSFDCTSDYVELFGHRIHDSHPIGEVLDPR